MTANRERSLSARRSSKMEDRWKRSLRTGQKWRYGNGESRDGEKQEMEWNERSTETRDGVKRKEMEKRTKTAKQQMKSAQMKNRQPTKVSSTRPIRSINQTNFREFETVCFRVKASVNADEAFASIKSVRITQLVDDNKFPSHFFVFGVGFFSSTASWRSCSCCSKPSGGNEILYRLFSGI